MKKIGWFTTARGPGSFNLFNTMLDNITSGGMEAELAFMFINRDVKGNKNRQRMIDMATENDIPVIIFPSDTFEPDLKERDVEAWRDAYGKGLRERIAPYEMDFGVLAGYMLIIDPETCRHHTLINLHPALPDTYKGTWEEIVGLVVDNRDDRYGATVHLCTPELDRGQTIAYDSFDTSSVAEIDLPREERIARIRGEEVRREAHLLMSTIKLLVEDRINVEKGRLVDKEGTPIDHYPCLSDMIDGALKKGR